MKISKRGNIRKLVASEGKRLTNKNRNFFVEFLYLNPNDAPENYEEVGREIWGHSLSDPILEEKIDLTEVKIEKIDEDQMVQDVAIDHTMVAVMESIDMILGIVDGLMGTMPNRTLELRSIPDSEINSQQINIELLKNLKTIIGGGSNMIDFYVVAIQRGLKKIEDVPERYRAEVKKVLEALEA